MAIFFAIFVLCILGLADAGYILSKKIRKEKLICFIGEDCDEVTKSRYGKTFGVPNEVFGVAYYLFIVGLTGFMVAQTTAIGGIPLVFLFRASAVLALLFSLYLLFVQAFILRKWCEYCLASAVVNVLLFGIALLL